MWEQSGVRGSQTIHRNPREEPKMVALVSFSEVPLGTPLPHPLGFPEGRRLPPPTIYGGCYRSPPTISLPIYHATPVRSQVAKKSSPFERAEFLFKVNKTIFLPAFLPCAFVPFRTSETTFDPRRPRKVWHVINRLVGPRNGLPKQKQHNICI